jgi:transposase-like protein
LSIEKVAAELGVNPKTLWKWVNQARLAQIDPGGTMPAQAAARIRDLERENARLRRDLEFEKKAGAFFRELDRDENGSL